MPPELTLLTINTVFVLFGYAVAYPLLGVRTAIALAKYDAIICGAALAVAGLLFWGRQVPFSLVLFDTNWFVFGVLTLAAIEVIPMILYLRHHKIDLSEDLFKDDQD